jgi:mono/diheme cytochrome c family protein
MNRVATLVGETGNQIELLRAAGYLSGPGSPLAYTPPHAVADDDSTTLEFRVRSYLATNCVQCHQPGGAAPSTWDARAHLTLEQTGLIHGIAERPGDDPLDRLIVPGDTQHSVLLQRIQAGNGFSRMPPLASHVLDQAAIDMVTAWITTELPGRILYDDWRATYFTGGDPAGERAADPDGDGLSNHEEFLRGSPPLSGSDAWQASLLHGEEGQRIRHLRKAHRGYLLETSDDLLDWNLWDDPANVLRYTDEDEWVELPLGSDAGSARFFRFQITDP